jgi:hypothetical protein
MGMSKQEKALYAQLTAAITAMQNPKTNPAQDYLTTQALSGADWINKGEFSSLPKGMFFDFQAPAQQIEQYKKYADVGQGGTFALADNAGRGAATQNQSQYLKDRFARDASQNYQTNVANAAGNIQGALGQAAGAKTGNDQAVIGALNSLFNSDKLKKTSIWGSLLGTIGQIGSSALGAAGTAGGFGALF